MCHYGYKYLKTQWDKLIMTMTSQHNVTSTGGPKEGPVAWLPAAAGPFVDGLTPSTVTSSKPGIEANCKFIKNIHEINQDKP